MKKKILPNHSMIDAITQEKLLSTLSELITSQKNVIREPKNNSEIESKFGSMNFSDHGEGIEKTNSIFKELVQEGLRTDHEGYLAYIGNMPTPVSIIADSLLSATGMIGSAWIGGAGLIYAEQSVLCWLAKLIGFPKESGGTFVSGGTIGNFSALAAAKEYKIYPEGKLRVIVSNLSHSSIYTAAKFLNLEIIQAPESIDGIIDPIALRKLIDKLDANNELKSVVAIVTCAGSTNTGQIDPLNEIGDITQQYGLWMHVDAAYGGAFLLSDSQKNKFSGINKANSIIIDPHKGLFVPYESCALIFSSPLNAAKAFVQEADYLDIVNADSEINPMHFGYHLSRRAKGIPLWFNLMIYGEQLYKDTIEELINKTAYFKKQIKNSRNIEIIEVSQLSILLFKIRNWQDVDYYDCSKKLLDQGVAYIIPTKYKGETVFRVCLMNPYIEIHRIDTIIKTIDEDQC